MRDGDGYLVLVRHGQSTDNEFNLFSGWRDPDLTEVGVREARAAGHKLHESGFHFDAAYTSLLRRARRSFELMREALGQPDLPVEAAMALNERDYGDLSGLNKEEARDVWGSDQVHLWRKAYRAVPPNGESLAMTAERTIPFYKGELEARLRLGDHILVVAHGNSLRSLVKHLDALTDEEIITVHIATSQILIYRIDGEGAVLSKTALLAPPAST